LQRAAIYKMFGSDGRSIILHGKFKEYLKRNNLINDYISHYCINSSDVNKLSMLGIKYLVTIEPLNLSNNNWILLNKSSFYPREKNEIGNEKYIYLYENTQNIGLAYLINKGKVRYLDNKSITFGGNHFHIKLPEIEKESELVVTFLNWPGYKAIVDSERKKIKSSPDYFLRIDVKPQNKSVDFYFEPVTLIEIAIYISGALVIALIIISKIKRYGGGLPPSNRTRTVTQK
ncbi:MAG: hypothetical protein Q8M92_10875, partial [Candidatus Subteraquimicrobiales bacterium]|nr:hypothetical protein [Candidatus Subteraquimicrobiales bacterium]